MSATIHTLPVRFRPRLVTPSEAAALPLHAITQQRMEQEQTDRRNSYGAPVIMALYFGEGMK